MRIDRHEIQTAAASRPHDSVDVLVVLHQDRDGVTLAQTGLAESMGELVGTGFQLVKADYSPRRVQDDSGFVGADMRADLHGPTVPSRLDAGSGQLSPIRHFSRPGKPVVSLPTISDKPCRYEAGKRSIRRVSLPAPAAL